MWHAVSPQFKANGQDQREEEHPQQPTIDDNAALRHGQRKKRQQRSSRERWAAENEEECLEYDRHLVSLWPCCQITLLALQAVQPASNWGRLFGPATVCTVLIAHCTTV